jgi:hypothetical protein
VQAFTVSKHRGRHFHPEADSAQLKRWLDAGGKRDAEQVGLDPGQLMADTLREDPAARTRAGVLVAIALAHARQIA